MTKQEIQQKVLQNGKPLSLNKFTWDEKTNTFSTNKNNLVFDFNDIYGINFITGFYCTFDTGNHCTFKTGSYCTFKTGDYCTFKTGLGCTFKTGDYCTFGTGYNCTFDTGYNCTFDTIYNCTFNTGSYCTFKTGSYCIFNNIQKNCILIRRDIFETYILPEDKSIKLNAFSIKGYKEIKSKEEIEITLKINGEEKPLSEILEETLLRLRKL